MKKRPRVPSKVFVLFLTAVLPLQASFAQTGPAADCIVEELSRATASTTEAEIVSPEVAAIEQKEKANLTKRAKSARFVVNHARSLGALAVGSAVSVVALSYQEQAKDWFDEHAIKPVRGVETRLFLIRALGGKEKVEGMIADFKSQDASFTAENWKGLARADQASRIAQQEGNFKNFLAPFRKYSSYESVVSKEPTVKVPP